MAVPSSGPINMKEIWQEIFFPGSGSPGNPANGVVLYGEPSEISESIWRNAIDANTNPSFPAGKPPYNMKAFLGYQHLTVPGVPIISLDNVSAFNFQTSWVLPGGSDPADDYDWRVDGGSNTNTTNTSVTVSTGISAGTYYDFEVRSNNASGSSNYGLLQVLTLPSQASMNSINVESSSELSFTWNANTGETVSNYTWQASTSSGFGTIADTGTLNGTSDNATGLASNTTYYVRVRANNTSGSGQWSSSLTATTEFANVAITGTDSLQREIEADWSNVGSSSYHVRVRRSGSIVTNWTNVGSALTYTRTDLNPDTTYEFSVRPTAPGGGEPAATTNIDTDPLGVPGTVSSTPSSTSALVSWGSATVTGSGNGSITYDWQYKLSTSGTWGSVNNTSGTTANITSLSSNTTYDFRVRTKYVNDDGAGSVTKYSTYRTSSFTTTSVVAPIVTIHDETNTSIRVEWTSASGADSYEILVKRSGTTVASRTHNFGFGSSHTFQDLVADSTFSVEVQSFSGGVGGGTAVESASTTSIATPTEDDANATGSSTATIDWNSITISGSGETGLLQYEYEYKIVSSTVTGPITTSNTVAILTSLTPNRTYNWRVSAKYTKTDAAGTDVAYSSYTSFSTNPFTTDKITLSTPSASAVTLETPTTFRANWTTVANASSYQIQVSSANFGGGTQYENLSTTASGSRSMTNGSSGYSRNGTYYVRFRANGTGDYENSNWSSSVIANTTDHFDVYISSPQKAVDDIDDKQYNYTIVVEPTMLNTGTYADKLEIYYDHEANASSSCSGGFTCSDANAQAGCYGNNSTLVPGGSSQSLANAYSGSSPSSSGNGGYIITGNFGFPIWLNVNYSGGLGDFGTGAQAKWELTSIAGNNAGQSSGYYQIDTGQGSGDDIQLLITN